MFTGIIEEIGEILAVQRNTASMILTIKAQKILDDIQVGDSVATNGVCLTVVGIAGSSFQADVMHETMRRSSLGKLKIGSRVNLERECGRTEGLAAIWWQGTSMAQAP